MKIKFKFNFRRLYAFSVFASIAICAIVLNRTVFAYSGGSETHGGVSCTSSNYIQKDEKGYHNCCMRGRSCPHYIYIPNVDAQNNGGKKTTNTAFVQAVNAGEDAAGFKNGSNGFDNTEAYKKCKTDPNGVVIVGTDYGTLRATNWHPPSGTDNKTKSGWDHSDVNWDQNWAKSPLDGQMKTFAQWKDLALYLAALGGKPYSGNGSNEYYLAFFCPTMISDPQDTIFNANSTVEVTVKLPSNLPSYILSYYRNILGGDSDTKRFSIFESGGGANWDTDEKNSELEVSIVEKMFGGEAPPVGTEVTVNFMHKIDVSPKSEVTPSASDPRKTEWQTKYSENGNVENAKNWFNARTPDSGTLTFTSAAAQTPAGWVSDGMVNFTVKKKGKEYKVCEKLTYGYKTDVANNLYTAKIDNSKRTNKVCASISGEEVDTGCAGNLPNNAVWSMTNGRSDAQSWVKKSSQETWSHLVYARPGEQVSFCHYYYAFAHSAKASLSWAGKNQNQTPGGEDHGYHYPAVYHPRTCWTSGDPSYPYDCSYYTRTRTSNASNKRISRGELNDYCELKAGVSWGGGNYLFERGKKTEDESLCNGDTGSIHTSMYSAVISFSSPFTESKGYGCNKVAEGNYQIVGYDPRSQCKKNGKTMTVSSGTDVGRTFYQYIYYGGTLDTASSAHMDYDAGLPAHYSYFYSVDVRNEGYRNGTAANVVVPYNFNTTATVTGNSSKIVYPGEPISFNTNVEFTPRYNPDVDPSEEYATITPPSSKIITVQFTLDPGVSQPSDLKGGITANGSEASVASYISSKTGSGFRSYVTETTASGAFNKQDRAKGLTGDKAITANAKYTIPDDEAGVKYCYAVAVYPADSHNKRIGEPLQAGDNDDGSGQEGRTAWRWRVSDIKCMTIAKKPNVQIWGSGLYSAGSVSSSTSTKCLDWVLSTNPGCSSKRRFGSWVENEIIANGTVVNFASSNGYGYDRYFQRGDYYNTWTLSAGLPGGNTSTQFTDVAKQTVSNNQPGGYGGYANVDISTDILDRILGRYSDSQPKGLFGGVYDNNNATSTAGSIYLGRDGGTVVIYTTNDFTINHDIVIENYGYDNISQIPQVLIIAPNISISSNVTRVDAWLIATNRVSGTVNTCKEFVNYTTQSTGPCNQMLTINGPIFSMRTLFNRTAGAGIGNQSINPAERINLSAANYLWAYSQAEQLQQAFTTYTRELAPRY